ncbi:DUF952 domain-containing protein [Acidocella sp.]|uniref:DUF952 domain-containing protein n=1 Tax=Acidocella sp. TaxID=50710 RepID=UPI003CFCD856
MTTQTAYKILTQEQFQALLAGQFSGAPVDLTDGYIHLSTASQLDETLARHFTGQENLVIAAVPLAALGPALRWEKSRGGQLFPHFYGRLEMRHVSAHRQLRHGADGRALLPA